MKTCQIDGCEKKHYGQGYCRLHWNRWYRHGDPHVISPDRREQRFWSHVDRSGDCWLWIGATGSSGYGRVRQDRVYYQAHRLAHLMFVGPIPQGYEVDHLCNVPLCVRPEHLEAVTPAENIARSWQRTPDRPRPDHCPQGHDYTPENTLIRSDGYRACRICRQAKDQRAKQRKKQVLREALLKTGHDA